MQDIVKFVGLDVSMDTIAVAVADAGRREARYWGTIAHTPEAVKKLLTQLGGTDEILACYEAGPTGYELQRFLNRQGVQCLVVAPTLIPKRPGDRVKTDRRDAIRLAQLLRAGELMPVYVPTEEDEALRDLTRLREDVKEDQLRARHRLSKFLLRHDVKPSKKMTKWKSVHRKWLDSLRFDNRALQLTFQEYLHTLDEIDQRLTRLDKEIHEQALCSSRAPVIEALQTLRGIQEITAVTLTVEVGDFRRFATAREFMGYTGLVPSEYSSGLSRRQGNITKVGNTHIRRVLVEAGWSYRHRPAVKGDIRRRQEGKPVEILRMSWNAQDRLHRKFNRLTSKGKPTNKAVVAVGRELAGFVWAMAIEVQRQMA